MEPIHQGKKGVIEDQQRNKKNAKADERNGSDPAKKTILTNPGRRILMS